jgi:hypothetical protein
MVHGPPQTIESPCSGIQDVFFCSGIQEKDVACIKFILSDTHRSCLLDTKGCGLVIFAGANDDTCFTLKHQCI